MQLRRLQKEDAPMMLEWMHDQNVVNNLQTDFSRKTIDDCQMFIRSCSETSEDCHLAIVSESNEYMGTVSLKHIDAKRKEAEFAIAIRSCAMGKGYSAYGMAEIIRLGFEQFNLNRVYWCVSGENTRAVRFYDKNGYSRIDVANLEPKGYTKDQIDQYIWYAAEKK